MALSSALLFILLFAADSRGMNLRSVCAAIPGTDQHQGSLPEAVKNLAGVGSSWFKNVLPTQSYSGGHNGMGASGGRVTASPVEDPLESEWHKQLVSFGECVGLTGIFVPFSFCPWRI